MNKVLRILGIDPGTATTGYGVIDLVSQNSYCYVGSGTIQTSKLESMSARLKTIREDLLSLIDIYNPHLVAVESIFFFKNAKTLVPVAQARGVILEAAASRGIKVAEYTPMQVKMSVCGYGRAQKSEVQFVVAKLLKHEQIIKPDDACDAVAVAICHARNRMPLTENRSDFAPPAGTNTAVPTCSNLQAKSVN